MSRPYTGRTAFLYALAALSFLGTVLLVAWLFTSSHRVCDSTGCYNVGDDRLPAVIALVVGIVQTAFLVTVAQMCQTLGRVIDRLEG